MTSSTTTQGIRRSRWAAIGAAVAISAGAGGLTFVSAATGDSGSAFVPISPCRIGDSRPAPNTVGPNAGVIGPKVSYTYSGRGTTGNCVLPTDTVALSVNLTSAGATERSFYTAYPAGTTRPLAAHLVPGAGSSVTENGVQIALSTDGKFTVYNDAGSSHIIIDVLGVFVPTSGGTGPAGPTGSVGPAGPAGPEKSLFAPDRDVDGFGDNNANAGALRLALTAPAGYAALGDCNDFDVAVNPNGVEILDTGLDENCDGQTLVTLYPDTDGDFYGTGPGVATLIPVFTGSPVGQALIGGDCNDGDSSINPGAFDVPGDGIDQDCNSSSAPKVDSDGDLEFVGNSYFSINQCSDGVDNDGDGQTDFGGDGQCTSFSDPFEGDCNDTNSMINSLAADPSGDGIDQNCNGDTNA